MGKYKHVFVDGSGREVDLDADEGVPNNEAEYRVTMTTVAKADGSYTFKHYVAR